MLQRIKNIGPGALIAAAFIGPGTVTACTLAGANFGYTLLWALLFATIATIILQEMSARLGLVTQKGLAETLRIMLNQSVWKWPLFILIIVALYLGNAAYEAGNLSGAALGIDALTDDSQSFYRISVAVISLLAGFLLWRGSYKQIERMLLLLVTLMALAFIGTFISVGPNFTAIFKGLTTPQIPDGSLLTVIALIGTTVVPYNLFLHASAVKAKWSSVDDLNHARADTATAIGLGGLITILIASTAAASIFGSGLQISGAGDMAKQLEPLFGSFSKTMLGVGFFAAGLSSSITAPLATAYAMTEILGIKGGTSSPVFKLIALSVVISGSALALTGIKPISIILAAQFANGLLLPIIAIFLLMVMNQKTQLGEYTNKWLGNTLGIIVVLITAGLGVRLILSATGVL
ncbi:Nramp family divalent metal transporter [Paraglaciecola arctica]|uniref:Natural resistance-associated macrophage protein n=1 Tax=Paraglaciecola arctica BSs20135 TaxID=493475 RepID=K6Z697_9ALTE|nr:Nramp family divalent metal transporter [Paraglaciecola arctica]GAC18960.1 natural resistance-associated macrophage protein [Paraglaciecola arctica BSs20135]